MDKTSAPMEEKLSAVHYPVYTPCIIGKGRIVDDIDDLKTWYSGMMPSITCGDKGNFLTEIELDLNGI